jgi:hypothetical protein
MFKADFAGAGVRTFIRFDDDRIRKLLDREERRNLLRAGAFVRTTMRRLIRKRKRPSAPGQPPSSHVGTLRRLIFFAFDTASRSVVVGPFSKPPGGSRLDRSVPLGRRTGAEVLEKGGRVMRLFQRSRARGRKAAGRMSAARVRRIREEYAKRGPAEMMRKVITVAARPFAAPALRTEMSKFAGLWSKSIRA